jgi:hypothetical protein
VFSILRLIAAAAFIIAVAAPALACERNKSARADSQSTVASQSDGAAAWTAHRLSIGLQSHMQDRPMQAETKTAQDDDEAD